MNHTLQHAIESCDCRTRDITRCVICGRDLEPPGRLHVDVCGKVCFKKLIKAQRAAGAAKELDDEHGDPGNNPLGRPHP